MMYDENKDFAVRTYNKNLMKAGYGILKAYKELGLISNLSKTTEKIDNRKAYSMKYTTSEEINKRIKNEFRMNF